MSHLPLVKFAYTNSFLNTVLQTKKIDTTTNSVLLK